MIGLNRAFLALLALSIWTAVSRAGTISGNVADYNAAQVTTANGILTVPALVATYTANSTVATGSSFVITLPAGFTFGSVPALTSSGTSTFTLASGGTGAQSATFTVATANLTSGQTILLSSFSIHGATALEMVTPVASALPLTMQAIGSDGSALPFKAFASDVGISAVFVGAIQFIDATSPSKGTKFGPPDTLTAVISAIAVSPQVRDAATGTVPIIGANGLGNTLSNTDQATVKIFGNFVGLARVFSSSNSGCSSPIANGTITGGAALFPNVAINTEVFFCETGSGGVIPANLHGFPNVRALPGSSTDFLAASANVEFPGIICYKGSTNGGGPFGCLVNFTPPGTAIPTPALSDWGMIGLAGMLLLFSLWKLKHRTA